MTTTVASLGHSQEASLRLPSTPHRIQLRPRPRLWPLWVTMKPFLSTLENTALWRAGSRGGVEGEFLRDTRLSVQQLRPWSAQGKQPHSCPLHQPRLGAQTIACKGMLKSEQKAFWGRVGCSVPSTLQTSADPKVLMLRHILHWATGQAGRLGGSHGCLDSRRI